MKNKIIVISQYTELDKEFKDNRETEQRILPFGDRDDESIQEDIKIRDIKRNEEQKKPTEPINFHFPQLTPEQLKYRKLNDKERQRLVSEDDYDYQQHQ